MKQYIEKFAIVTEIKRYKHKADERLKIKGRTLAEDLKDLALQNILETDEPKTFLDYREISMTATMLNNTANHVLKTALTKSIWN